MAQAQEAANRTVQLARDKSEELVARDPIVQAAQTRAEQIIQQSTMETEVTKREADEFVLVTLTRLEAELQRLLNQVQNGIQTLQPQQLQNFGNPAKQQE
jgi:vacuolar-type H+-ATPase subunit H